MRQKILAGVALLFASPANANETVTYTYDALGRLIQASHAGTVNGGLQQSYAHDAADNRTGVTVSGSPYNSSTRVIVVPIGGLTVVIIGN